MSVSDKVGFYLGQPYFKSYMGLRSITDKDVNFWALKDQPWEVFRVSKNLFLGQIIYIASHTNIIPAKVYLTVRLGLVTKLEIILFLTSSHMKRVVTLFSDSCNKDICLPTSTFIKTWEHHQSQYCKSHHSMTMKVCVFSPTILLEKLNMRL